MADNFISSQPTTQFDSRVRSTKNGILEAIANFDPVYLSD